MEESHGLVRRWLSSLDWISLGLSIVCACYGLVLVYSATYSTGSHRQVLVQGFAFILGLIGFAIASLIDLDHLSHLWRWVYLANLLFVASLFFFGVDGGTGNKSWIRFSYIGIGIQPAEIGKLLMIFTLSQHIRLLKADLSSFFSVFQLAAHIGIISAAVYVFSNDLGMVLAFLFIGLLMLFVAGLKLRWFALAGFLGFAGLPVLWNFLSEKQKNRILVVFDPSISESAAWHAEQSKLALGAGQFSGQGLLQGSQTQYSQLPAKHTDFIFAVAGEEFGFIGCLLIILLLSALICRIFYVAWQSPSLFYTMICTGVGAGLLFQSLINIGMCVGLTPVIGLTLPFYSYGGSSLLTSFISIGFVSRAHAAKSPGWRT